MPPRRPNSTSSIPKAVATVPTERTKPLSEHARRFLANIPVVASAFIAVFLIVLWSADKFEPPQIEPPTHGPPFILPDKLQRHGARFPTKGQGEKIKRALSHIKIPSARAAPDSILGFMRKYRYNLGTEDLLYFGANE
ncbi:hypothetical protein FRC17_003291 [Serendipita sp. 399]|nr:hypothetical protein FRC17_003291 [Serendipita sp. 399]